MTKSILLTTLLLAATAGAAFAAPAAYLTIDHSSQAVMDKATAQAIWKEHLPDNFTRRLFKLYPSGKYGFFSQVEGGFTESKLCVVTARAMMLPRAGKVLQAIGCRHEAAKPGSGPGHHEPGAEVKDDEQHEQEAA